MSSAILVVAKAPVPGFAKTRLIPAYGEDGAARLAAGALLDTVRAALEVVDADVIVAHTGDFGSAVWSSEIRAALSHCRLIPQRGDRFATRLTHAHCDAVRTGARRVVQIGMDTPQITAAALTGALDLLDADRRVGCLGPADDGGWWALGTCHARGTGGLGGVVMSTPTTYADTRTVMQEAGLRVTPLPRLTDVDTAADVHVVAAQCASSSRFADIAALLEPHPATVDGVR